MGAIQKERKKKDSDLDLFIAGTYQEEKIKEISQTYGITISVKKYPIKLFEKSIREDILIKEVLEHHILIKGREEFMEKVLRWTR